MTSGPSRTFIGSVVCVDLVGYSKRSIAQQSSIKAEFNRLLSLVLKPIRPEDRIILDTGDGVAITFLGDPDDCLTMGLEMRDVLNTHGMKLGAEPGDGPVRIGMNLGPLKVAIDLNGRPNIVGDGIVVAERIASFAQPGQIVASRSFHDMVSRLSDEHLAMFKYEGRHSDKNAREHEIYMVSDPRRRSKLSPKATPAAKPTPVAKPTTASEGAAAAQAGAQVSPSINEPATVAPPKREPAPKPAAPAPPQRERTPAANPATASPVAAPAPRKGAGLVAFLRNPIAVGATAVVLLGVIFAEAWMLDRRLRASETAAAPAKSAEAPPKVAASPVPTQPAPKVEPTLVTKPATASQGAPAEPAPAVGKPGAGAQSPTESTRKPEPPATTHTAAAKPEPAPPRAVVPAPRTEPTLPAKAAEPPKADPPKSQRAVLEPPKVESAKAERPKSEPAPAPPATAPAPPPQEAAPAPAPQPTAVVAAVTPITRVAVSFPRAAARQGIESGVVKARLAINAEGRVTDVRILSSTPAGVFDREAVRALEEWRFNTGAAQRSYEVEIAFKR